MRGSSWAPLCLPVCLLLCEPTSGDGRPVDKGRVPLEHLDPYAIRFSHAKIYPTFSCGR